MNNLKELLNFNNVALLGIITYILKSIKGYAFSIYNNIMQRFRKSITIADQTLIERTLIYINKVCYSNINKELLADNILYTSESNCSLTFGRYLIRIDKFTWISIVSSKTSENNYNNSQLRVTLLVTFYGLNRRKYIDEFKSALSIDNEAANTLYMLSLSGRYDISTSIKKKRNNKKVFGKAAEEVGKLIDRFIDNKSLYEKYNKNYKLVILLYGPPGTGKSTMITSFALRLKSRYVYYIDKLLRSDDNAGSICGALSSNSYYCSTVDNKPIPAIFVIEDIDRSVLSESHTDKNTREHDVVNNLMQVLDSGITPPNSIFIITTNHIEKIPDQVKRVGRIDYTIYVGNLDRDEAIEMCRYYEVDPDKYLDKDKTEFNPAELETAIFKDIDKILRGE